MFQQAGFKNEFTTCSVVDTAAAMGGHEDELVKTLTLLMYLGTVKHLSQELSSSLQVGLGPSVTIRPLKRTFQNLIIKIHSPILVTFAYPCSTIRLDSAEKHNFA